MAALVAAAVALAASAGGLAWVASNSSPPIPREPSTSASVAPDEGKPSGEPEQAKVPARNVPTQNDEGGTSGRPAPERPENGDPAPRDEPTAKPSPKPTGKPSQEPSEEPEEDPSDQVPEEEQGDGTDEGSGQDDTPGEGQQGDSSDQVDPNAGTAALETGTGGEGEIGRAGAAR